MTSSRIDKAMKFAEKHGMDFRANLVVGGAYVPAIEHEGLVYVSGQIPRIGTSVVVTGRAGETVGLAQAQVAAEVCALRVLAVLDQNWGLQRIARFLKLNVYIQCAVDFTQQSEVADAASQLISAVLGESGSHTRTSVGVYQLPKNGTVELDAVVALRETV